MNRREKVELLNMLTEKQRRLSRTKIYRMYPEDGPLRRELYVPHCKFFEAGVTWRERAIISANRVGKSEGVGGYELTLHLTGQYPDWWTGRRFNRPIRAWAAGDTSQTVRDIIQNKLLGPTGDYGTGLIPGDLIVNTKNKAGSVPDTVESIAVKHVSGGISHLGLKSYDQRRKSFQGTEQDVIWCVAKGQRVLMADGVWRSIEDIKPKDVIISEDVHGRLPKTQISEVKKLLHRGDKEVLRIKCQKGICFEVTPDHLILVSKNWTRKYIAAKDFQVGDKIICKLNEIEGKNTLPLWKCALLGLMIGDGCTRDNRIKITNGSEELIEKIEKILPENIILTKLEYKDDHVPDYFITSPEGAKFGTTDNEFKDFVKDCGLFDKLAHEKFVPDIIFKQELDNIALFLSYLFAADGWANGHTIGYCTTSKRLAQDVYLLLRRFKIRSSICIKTFMNAWRDQYWVMISMSRDVVKFIDDISIVSKKISTDRVREEAFRRMHSRYECCKFKNKKAFLGVNSFTPERVKIKSIEKIGTRPVYDIVLNKTDKKELRPQNNFIIQGGIVSHNCDEECDLGIYAECLLRTMTTDGLVMCTFTPLLGLSETVLSFMPGGKIPEDFAETGKYVVNATWDDAPHLTEEQKADLLKSIPAYQRDARAKGIPQLGSGAIYPIAEENITIEPFEIPPSWPRVYALDVGWRRTAALWGAWDQQSDVVYLYSEHYQGLAEPLIHAEAIKARGSWIPGVVDPASQGASQTDGKRLIDMYADLGLNLSYAQNAVETGIQKVWTRLSTGKLKVFASLRNFFAEYRIYRRDEKGKIVKENDHLCDCLRYLCFSGLAIATTAPPDEYAAWDSGYCQSDTYDNTTGY